MTKKYPKTDDNSLFSIRDKEVSESCDTTSNIDIASSSISEALVIVLWNVTVTDHNFLFCTAQRESMRRIIKNLLEAKS